jgi:hypothetical protein
METNDDPTIAEIRETRHQISEEFGHDPGMLVEYYIELQKKYESRLLKSEEQEDPQLETITA